MWSDARMNATRVGDWTVTPLSERFGARIEGCDLRALDADGWAEVDRLYARHRVLAFVGQDLTVEQHVAVGEHFGDPYVHPFLDAVPEHPAVLQVFQEPDEAEAFGGEYWHCDISFRSPPAATSLLYALEVPPVGGDTLFADQVAALAALPADVRDRLDGLTAVHAYPDMEETPETAAVHPVVRAHPVTGEEALYVNPAFAVRIVELPGDEGAELLAVLFAHQVCDEFRMAAPWTDGQLLVWDNRVTLHHASNDHPGHRRHLRRVTSMERVRTSAEDPS